MLEHKPDSSIPEGLINLLSTRKEAASNLGRFISSVWTHRYPWIPRELTRTLFPAIAVPPEIRIEAMSRGLPRVLFAQFNLLVRGRQAEPHDNEAEQDRDAADQIRG
jgi:hypothetical protein